jgi:hypothetical protein
VRDVLHSFNTDGVASLCPKYAGGRPPKFLAFCRYLRALHPPKVRISIILDSLSPHLSTRTDTRVGDWTNANNVELAYMSFYGSWLNHIEARFTALRYFALRRHGPRRPRRTGQHDPPLHRVAEPHHHRPTPTQGGPTRQHHQEGEGCLTRH